MIGWVLEEHLYTITPTGRIKMSVENFLYICASHCQSGSGKFGGLENMKDRRDFLYEYTSPSTEMFEKKK
ncbi:hypothetical protein TSAR_003198 [Trichomalopsis sarcophagae]|uniref:Uncharacterized protein n=1 Tax=Trichomalopsis sarcophagae TaxID=543379 RepID=A0A232FK83_9HYME|nr:hypothetical protein TSAR_003198 [Trichomalopsis sarcophagae]